MNIKEVVSIFPKRTGSTTKLTCTTQIGNKWFILSTDWKILPLDMMGKPENLGKKVMVIDFSRQKGSYRFTFDMFPQREKPTDSHIDKLAWQNERELETDKHAAAFNFFAKHMQVEVIGMKNPYLKGEAMFVMDFVNHRTINNCLNSDKKVAVYNKVNSMSFQEKMNMALFFQPNLYGKRHSEIKNELINWESGLLLQEAYIDEALKYNDKETTTAMRTYVNKAIQIGVLLQVPNGFAMKQGNVFVGQNEVEIMGYFLKDPASYNNVIVPSVNANNHLPEDDLVFVDHDLAKRLRVVGEYEASKETDRLEYLTKFQMMEAEAEALGVKNVNNKSFVTISDEVDRIKRGVHDYIKPKHRGEGVEKLEDLLEEAKILGMKHYQNHRDPIKLRTAINDFTAKQAEVAPPPMP